MSSCSLPCSCLFYLCMRDKFRSSANLSLCCVAKVFLNHGWENKNNTLNNQMFSESLHAAAKLATKLFCQKC